MLLASVLDATGQTTSKLASPSKADVRVNTQNYISIDDAVINEYSTVQHRSTPKSRPMVDPFNCESGLVYIITNTTSPNGNVSGLHSYNLGTKTQTLIKYPLINSTTTSQFVNAVGYNVIDNYIYGILQGTDKVVKIDATGAMEYLTITGDFDNMDYSSGDVDKNGVLYIYGQGKFVSINLNPSASDYLVAKTLLRNSKTFHDMAFSPIDDNLYIVTSDSRRTLLRFNITTNTLTELGNVTGLGSESTDSFGTAFMDSMGNMYISNNFSGNIYKIASPHSGSLVAVPFNSLTGSPGDGARCPYKSISPNAVNDQACLIKNETISIDLIQNDGSGTYPIDLASVQLIDPITNVAATTVTIAGQGSFSVDNKGIMTFTPQATFTDASINYTISDTVGLLSNQASITVTLNTTTVPTGDNIQSFCTTEDLTITDLKASGSSIKWYASATSTTALPSSTVLEEKTYYAAEITTAGCESLERLPVTVQISGGVSLVGSEVLSCINNKSAYIIEATFSGIAPLTASGDGAPGVFTDNGNKTFSWVSSPIPSSLISYNVEIRNVEGCNSAVLSGDAPFDCLALPFNCDDGLAFILTNTGNDQDNYVTGLYTLNLATNVQNLVKYPLVEDASSPHRFINAIGYNILDNYLYGLLQRTNKIAKIDNAGDVEYLDITGSFTPGYYSSGDIDHNGVLYLYNGSKFVSINLNPANPNYLVAINLVNYSASVNDLAYNVLDNNIYMVTSTSTPNLLRYNVAANSVTDLGIITGLEAETTSSFGTAFMDSMGNLFIANNASGNTYKIASPETGGVAAAFYSSAMVGLQPGDGARCQNQITLPVANDDTACGTADTNTIINVLANDGEGSYALDISSVQLIDPVTLAPATSVEIADQGTFTVDANGVVTFSPVATFTEASVQYFMKDILANESQPAIVSVYLNTTEAPTGESNQNFCASSEPTVANLSATGKNILWYGSADGTVPLNPTTPLVNDAIYYGTQTNDEGCESIERLQVTVSFKENITLVNPETAICDADGKTYTVEATFSGTAPFTITGMNTPGTWIDNRNGTHTWLSDAIAASVNYMIEVKDANGCNTISLSAAAPNCCDFEVVCPTFADLTIVCYAELPMATTYTVQDFETLGNKDGRIGNSSCGIIKITASNSADNGECSQTVTRTYTITEYADDETTVINSMECVQIINVQDITAPVFGELPKEITVECGSTYAFAQATATDTCDSEVTLTYEDVTTAGACDNNYSITRTWTATDACGNASTASQTINIQDTTAPALVNEYEAEITITCDNIPMVPELVFEDACSNDIEVTFNETSTATNNNKSYVITRTWTVSDLCDNESIHTQVINVNIANPIAALNTELCNDDDFDFDLFSLLSGTVDPEVGTWSVVSGNATLDGSTFNPYQLNLGTYTFKYALADEYCPSETLVNIVLNDDCVPLSCGAEDVVISKAVTTHADGKNDFFTITGVETCGFTYEVQIFNRWGAMIYESNNYQNDWNGTASKASIGSSNYVPTGTYYYVVNLKNSGLKPFAGPIYVATK
ncbi:MAG: gliding motility-associated C-terminal domain-containing protein [Gelidibacter sp.]